MESIFFEDISSYTMKFKNGGLELNQIGSYPDGLKTGDVLRMFEDGKIVGYCVLEKRFSKDRFQSSYFYHVNNNTRSFTNTLYTDCHILNYEKASYDEAISYKKTCLERNLWFDSYGSNKWITLIPKQEYFINDTRYIFIAFDSVYGLILGNEKLGVTQIFVEKIKHIRDYILDDSYYG